MTQRNSTQSSSNSRYPSSEGGPRPHLDLAVDHLKAILSDGLKHGYFKCQITSEIGKNQRRELLIQFGKSHKFTIPYDELPS